MTEFGIKVKDGESILSEITIEENEKTVELHDWQRRAIKYFFDNDCTAIFEAATGAGKCLKPGTKIIMFDGSIRKVEDVKIGDKLMGDDSTPRIVTSLANGKEMMYDIIPVKGDKYTVNESHILSLKYTNITHQKRLKNGVLKKYTNKKSGEKIDISLKEYLLLSKSKKHILKGYRVPIDFKEQHLEIDPYWLGLWLGDGYSHTTAICNPDEEIINYIKMYAKKLKLNFSCWKDKKNKQCNGYSINNGRGKYCHLLDKMKKLNLIHNKHIPQTYKINSRKNRLELLAGLLDTDGSLSKNCFEITQKNKKLTDDILFLARSLGFAAYTTKKEGVIKKLNFKGLYYRIFISGDCSIIPTKVKRKQAKPREQKKNVLMTGIEIKQVGIGDYYGFEIEGINRRFLLEDFTVVHNSFFAIKIMQEVLKKDPEAYILIVVPKNVILERTWFKELYDAGFTLKDIGVFYGSIKEYSKITITNMQSLDKVALDIFNMVCFDEIHNYCTKRLWKYIKHPFKYRLGLSATLERSDNAHYKLMEHFNYNVFKYTPKEALQDGVLNPFNFTNIGIDMDAELYEKYVKLTEDFNLLLQMGGGFNKIMNTNSPLKNQMLAKMNERKQLVFNYPKKFGAIVDLCKIHKHDKILVFNEFNEQTSATYWHLLEAGLNSRVMHSGISKEKREQNLTDFKNDKYNILCTSRVLDEGYNLPKIDTAIIVSGNATGRQAIQRMGRVLRKKEKISSLYQIYVKGTMEQEYAYERAKIFKELSNEYQDIDFK